MATTARPLTSTTPAPTYEEIERHIDQSANEIAALQRSLAAPRAAAAAMDMGQLCRVYQVVKPVLAGILAIPLIPAKFKAPIQLLTGALDAVCQ